MGVRTQIGMVKEEDEKVEGLTVSELVGSLKSAFRNACFTRVEEILVSREEKLKREIESKNTEIKSLMEKLQRSQKEFQEVKKFVSCLSEERDGLLKKVKESEGDKQISELKKKICELECAKLKAETEADLCSDRFKGLEKKVFTLEKDYEMLGRLAKNGEAVHVEIEKDITVDLHLDTNAGKTKANEEVESRLHGVEETGKFDSDESMLLETKPSPNLSGGSSHKKRIGKTKANEEVESRLHGVEETGKFDSDERMLLETNPNPNLGGGSSHKKRTDNLKPLMVDIVEIIDSDDESDSPEGAKETVTKEQVQKIDPGQNAAEKEPSVDNRTSASSLDVHDGRPTKIVKRDLEKVFAENEQVVLKKTPASSVDVQDGRPIERGKRESVKKVAENEPAVLKKASASSMDVENGRPSPTKRGKRDSGDNVAENVQAPLKKISASSMDANDGRPIEGGTRDSGKNAAENKPPVYKRTSVSSMDVEDGRPTEGGKRSKIEKHVPFASPAARNLGTHYAGKGEMTPDVLKILSEFQDDNSSSSSSDDEMDVSHLAGIGH